MKEMFMAGTNAARRTLAARWPLCVAVILPLMGCGGTNYPGPASVANGGNPAPAPSHPGAVLRLARATRLAGELTTAIRLYKSLAASPSVAPEILVEYGDVLAQGGFPYDAIDAYSRVRPGSPVYLSALLGLARAKLKIGDPTAALGYLTTASRAAPRDARVLVDKGVALDTLGQHAAAQAAYRTALSDAPQNVAARNNLALSLAITGQFQAAITLITPLARSASATPRTRQNMALIYGLMGDSQRAASISRIDLGPRTTRANMIFLAAVRRSIP